MRARPSKENHCILDGGFLRRVPKILHLPILFSLTGMIRFVFIGPRVERKSFARPLEPILLSGI
ncbi:hypothetical protein P609_15240 [Comamonas thiooxydans]|nr:hypothetical protein P609_15240 [Comamonas thiooxydans]